MEHTLVLRALAAYPNEKTGSFIHMVKNKNTQKFRINVPKTFV
jgi:hypothetical protein